MTAASTEPLRVLIVDDDPAYRQILTKVCESIAGLVVVGATASLETAREKISVGDIDFVTLDVVLQGESGLDLLPWLHQHFPRIITVLITSGLAREARQAVDALLLGASALILKPTGPDARVELTKALSNLARDFSTRPSDALTASTSTRAGQLPAPREIIAIGASTGGPPVITQFLKKLPSRFIIPILVTQHMPALHVPYFAELLGRETGRAVRLATHGDFVEPGGVYIACNGKHMRIARAVGRLIIVQDDGPEEHNCRPAVDPMFRSVADVCGAASVGVVMTGMGNDGALGSIALRKYGAPVVVQDRATSVVWGMPGGVVTAGAASAIASADSLADWVVRWTSGHKSAESRGL